MEQTDKDKCSEVLTKVAVAALSKSEEEDNAAEAIKEASERISKESPYQIKMTPLGERWVYKREGEDYVAPLSLMTYPGIQLNVVQHDLIAALYTAAQYIIKTKRKIPLTRSELIAPKKEGGCTEFGYKKGDLQKLEKKLLIKVSSIFLSSKTTKKSIGARVVVYLTPLGRGYVQKFIDKEFMSDGEVPKVDGGV